MSCCGYNRNKACSCKKCVECQVGNNFPMIIPVEEVPSPEVMNRYSMYLTADNLLYILDYEGVNPLQIITHDVPVIIPKT